MLDDLLEFCREIGLSPTKLCIVGSAALERVGYRKANDLDVAITNEALKSIWWRLQWRARKIKPDKIAISDDIELTAGQYVSIGADDEALFSDKLSTSVADAGGIRFLRPEVAYAFKRRRDGGPDRADIAAVDKRPPPDWNPDLVSELLAASPLSAMHFPRRSLIPYLIRKITGRYP